MKSIASLFLILFFVSTSWASLSFSEIDTITRETVAKSYSVSEDNLYSDIWGLDLVKNTEPELCLVQVTGQAYKVSGDEKDIFRFWVCIDQGYEGKIYKEEPADD